VSAVRFLPEAEAELLHEVEYYSSARTGSGIRFQAAVEAALERATRHPLGGAPSHHSTRSVLVKGFPFSVVYRLSVNEFLVVAIAPHRRRPGYWLARLSDAPETPSR
jgi:plasmid stabilization system protein ParE